MVEDSDFPCTAPEISLTPISAAQGGRTGLRFLTLRASLARYIPTYLTTDLLNGQSEQTFNMTLSPAFPFSSKVGASTERSRRLHIGRAELAAAIRIAGPQSSLLCIIAAHAWTNFQLARTGVRYLETGSAAGESYQRMSTAQFARINGRQAWANWRTISSNLSGNLPTDYPLTVLDLCCGTGESTQVLAWWLPSGSQILGYEQDARFAEAASGRPYRNRYGDTIRVRVQRASVLERFLHESGRELREGEIDMVHAIGSLGCHFKAQDSQRILVETARVLKPGALALLDAGNAGTPSKTLKELASGTGLKLVGCSRSWWFDRYVQLVLRKPS